MRKRFDLAAYSGARYAERLERILHLKGEKKKLHLHAQVT